MSLVINHCKTKTEVGNPTPDGSPNWARTSDIMINSHALYRLSYRGKSVVHLQGLEPWTH